MRIDARAPTPPLWATAPPRPRRRESTRDALARDDADADDDDAFECAYELDAAWAARFAATAKKRAARRGRARAGRGRARDGTRAEGSGDDGTRARAEAAARRAETLARAAATARAKRAGEGEETDEEGRDAWYGAGGAAAVAMAEGKLNAAFDAWLDAGEARWWPSGLR